MREERQKSEFEEGDECGGWGGLGTLREEERSLLGEAATAAPLRELRVCANSCEGNIGTQPPFMAQSNAVDTT